MIPIEINISILIETKKDMKDLLLRLISSFRKSVTKKEVIKIPKKISLRFITKFLLI
jgi:hypothetical protein